VDFLPIFLRIRDRPCLVVGGGAVAARKVELLLQAGGRVTVVAPELGEALQSLHQADRIGYRPAAFSPADLEGCLLVIAATDDPVVNRQVSELCQARAIPVNVVDRPELCSFIMPAIIDREPVLIAVSTGGSSPVLARLLRGRLESLIPAAYGRLATLVAGFRERVKQCIPAPQRRAFWEQVLQGPIAELVLSGREGAAREALTEALQRGGEPPPLGEVYLVGAGPGDPDLLTFRALRLMQQADVVLYDRLVNPAILELTRRDAERIYVGKARDRHILRQEETNALLARLAKQGKRVLRLKGGDPFIFGRGGEEIQTLAGEGIPFQVVPGITAASGCAAYAGIPLTHRDYAQSCVFVTGNLKDGSVDLNWESLVQPHQTVVIYMGLHGLELICAELINHGLPPDFPAALIEQGTTPRQRVHVATLATLPERVRAAGARAPTLIIVGEVVKLHQELAWFEPCG
jgi:uroporphyrin-III C-methyltransferase/precorrin-2 dehydrogenase/sirohydrochlorin ferrochelatase